MQMSEIEIYRLLYGLAVLRQLDVTKCRNALIAPGNPALITLRGDFAAFGR